MEKKSDSGCSTVLIYTGLILLAIATWKTVQFLQKPDASRIIGNTLLDRKGTYDEFLADFDEDQLKKY